MFVVNVGAEVHYEADLSTKAGFCDDPSIWKRKGVEKDVCETKCSAMEACRFYSFSTAAEDSPGFCRLTSHCDARVPKPPTFPTGFEVYAKQGPMEPRKQARIEIVQKPGRAYLNIALQKLADLRQADIGGLLGLDDHDLPEPTEECQGWKKAPGGPEEGHAG